MTFEFDLTRLEAGRRGSDFPPGNGTKKPNQKRIQSGFRGCHEGIVLKRRTEELFIRSLGFLNRLLPT